MNKLLPISLLASVLPAQSYVQWPNSNFYNSTTGTLQSNYSVRIDTNPFSAIKIWVILENYQDPVIHGIRWYKRNPSGGADLRFTVKMSETTQTADSLVSTSVANWAHDSGATVTTTLSSSWVTFSSVNIAEPSELFGTPSTRAYTDIGFSQPFGVTAQGNNVLIEIDIDAVQNASAVSHYLGSITPVYLDAHYEDSVYTENYRSVQYGYTCRGFSQVFYGAASRYDWINDQYVMLFSSSSLWTTTWFVGNYLSSPSTIQVYDGFAWSNCDVWVNPALTLPMNPGTSYTATYAMNSSMWGTLIATQAIMTDAALRVREVKAPLVHQYVPLLEPNGTTGINCLLKSTNNNIGKYFPVISTY